MSKKIKITEEQLKRLIQNKDTQINEQESSLDELVVYGEKESELANEVAPLLVDKLLEKDLDISKFSMPMFSRALQQKIELLLNDRAQEPDLNGSEIPSNLANLSEQKQQIKNEFKRFL